MNALTIIGEFLLKQVADVILGADTFARIQGAVERWEEKEISSVDKKAGVVAELELLGIELAASLANWAIETAVQLVKSKA